MLRRARAGTRFVGLASVAIVLFARTTVAAPNVAIELDAREGCPDRGDFFAELKKRVPGAELTTREVATYAARLRLGPGAKNSFTGTLDLTFGAGIEPTTRTVEGGSCAEVGEALALVLALAVEEREVAVKAAAQETPPKPPAPPPTPPPPAPAPPIWRVAIVGTGGVRSGLTPNETPTTSLGAELRRSRAGFGLAPSARAKLGFSAGDLVFGTPSQRRAIMRFIFVGIDGCALRLATEQERLSVDACATLEIGALDGRVRPDALAGGTGPFISLGGALRARLILFGPLFVELDGGGAVAPIQNRWAYGAGGRFFFEQPLTLWTANAGLGVTIP